MTVLEPASLSTLRSRVFGLLALLMFLAGLFTALDFSHMYMALIDHVPHDAWPNTLGQTSAWVRMLRSVLCLVLVLMIGPATWLRKWDDRLLTGAFLCAILGDSFLIFCGGAPPWVFMLGVAAFLACHGILTVRHMRGFMDDLGKPGVLARLVIAAVLITAASGGLLWAFRGVIEPPLDVPYGAALSLSLWAAVGAAIRADDNDFPSANRWLIAVGLALFYICDVALGMKVRLVQREGHTPLALCMGMVPDLTYSWALIGLALSGFRWDALTGRQRPPRPA